MKIKQEYMADGLFVYKTENGYCVMNENDDILKSAKTIQTCNRYVDKELKQRRAAEREAIEKINQDH